MSADGHTGTADGARARGATYALMAWALRYPSMDVLDVLRDARLWQSAESPADAPSGQDGGRLPNLLTDLKRRATVADAQGLQQTHSRLFGHTVRGSCPPYELEYGRSEIIQQAAELADVAGFYEAFGVRQTDDSHERADHAAVECEFMAVLAAKEAYALQQADHAALDVCRQAQQSFLADHLGQWMPALARRIAEADRDGFYGALGRLAGDFLAAECRGLGVTCGPTFLELRPVDPTVDASMSCGADHAVAAGRPDQLIQIGVNPGLREKS